MAARQGMLSKHQGTSVYIKNLNFETVPHIPSCLGADCLCPMADKGPSSAASSALVSLVLVHAVVTVFVRSPSIGTLA